MLPESPNPFLEKIYANSREILAARCNPLDSALDRLLANSPSKANINTYKSEPESVLENWAWEFDDGIYVITSCDAPRLLKVIEDLVARIRALEKYREEDAAKIQAAIKALK